MIHKKAKIGVALSIPALISLLECRDDVWSHLKHYQFSSEMRPAGIIYQGTQTPVSGFIERRFKVLKPTSFATRQKKVNAFQVDFSECPLGALSSVLMFKTYQKLFYFFPFFFVNAQFNVLQRQKKLLKMSVWKTEKHDIAFSIYKPFDVRSYSDKQEGCVFCNKSRLLRGMCIISTSVSNMTVLQSNETSHEIGLSI